MCGFVGGLLRGSIAPERLDRALQTLHHRGPDAAGRWIAPDGRWFLGHTRLSIIGLGNGAQPMSDASGDVFASSLLDEQPIFDPAAVRGLFRGLPRRTPAERTSLDGLLNRVLSLTLMHRRFGMSA